MGWVKSGADWGVVYLTGGSAGPCGLQGAVWNIGLVATKPLPFHLANSHTIGGAMCGNALAWVQAGRFSDGLHDEIAFMLWTTPALGARAYIYRQTGGHLHLLGSVAGDRFRLRKGEITATFENRQRSPNGKLAIVYRYRNGAYREAQ